MNKNLNNSGNFVVYINEYASSRPQVVSKSSSPDSIADLTLNKRILIPQMPLQETISVEDLNLSIQSC